MTPAGNRRAPRVLALLALLAPLSLAACGYTLPTPPRGPHTADDPAVLIPYPPPPARVEIIPLPPEGLSGAVWLDGEWQWRGRRWVWLPGRWEVPFPGAYYALATAVRRATGDLIWFAGAWHFPEAKKK